MISTLKKIIISSLSVSILTLCITSCAVQRRNPDGTYIVPPPTLTSINIIDRNGMSETISSPERLEQYECVDFLAPQSFQKVLRIYSRDCEGNIPACITSYHPNGVLHKYLEIMNSRASGIYREWHPNGVKRIEVNILEGIGDISAGSEKTWIFDGCSHVWNECGDVEAIIPYSKGNLDGCATYYHKNGQIWKNIFYTDNLMNGPYEIYKSDGTLLYECNYIMGAREGKATRYWNPCKIASEEIYCDGYLVTGTYYNFNDVCIATIVDGTGTKAVYGKEEIVELREYHNGILEGKIQCIDTFGRITKIYHVKNGCKYGEEITFYEAPRLQKVLTPKLSVNWYDGKIQGTIKSWYDNGTQESQREMSNNKRNGHSTAWFRDGSLMMIEEYEQDKLVKGEYYSLKEKDPVSQVNEGFGTATLYDGEGNFIQKVTYQRGKPVIEE